METLYLPDAVRRQAPIVHCITNYVTANDCANLLLAAGASPIMADAPEEVAEITACADALVLNLGTPSPRRISAMLTAGEEAARQGKAIVIDPVGVGASTFRQNAVRQLLARFRPTVIRGNLSEIRTLATGRTGERGVDAESDCEDGQALAVRLARAGGAVVVLSGETDLITDGKSLVLVHGGSALQRSVTGSGCMLSALTGAYLAAAPDRPLEAAVQAARTMAACASLAESRLSPEGGNATFRSLMIDAVYNMKKDAFERTGTDEL